MNGPFNTNQQLTDIGVELEALLPSPLLLPGESIQQYGRLRQAILTDIAPRSAIEWLLAVDVAELTWEIQRYWRLRHRLLQVYRQNAIEATLRRIDMAGIASEIDGDAEYYTRQNVLSWKHDPTAAMEIEQRLASYGFDQHSINMEVYVQARDVFILFDSLLNGAQARRLMLLKEIKNCRGFQSQTSRSRISAS